MWNDVTEPNRMAFLDLLLSTCEDRSVSLSDEDLRDEVNTFILEVSVHLKFNIVTEKKKILEGGVSIWAVFGPTLAEFLQLYNFLLINGLFFTECNTIWYHHRSLFTSSLNISLRADFGEKDGFFAIRTQTYKIRIFRKNPPSNLCLGHYNTRAKTEIYLSIIACAYWAQPNNSRSVCF